MVTVLPRCDRFTRMNETFCMVMLQIFYFSNDFCTLFSIFAPFLQAVYFFLSFLTILTGLDHEIRNSFGMTFSRILNTKLLTLFRSQILSRSKTDRHRNTTLHARTPHACSVGGEEDWPGTSITVCRGLRGLAWNIYYCTVGGEEAWPGTSITVCRW